MSVMDQVRAARLENPHISASKMADDFKVSREYIRQCLIKLEMPTKVPTGKIYGPPRRSFRYGIPLHSHVAGAIGELEVCADLLKRGFHVFRAVSFTSPCDLIALVDGDKAIRVEVRSAKKGRFETHGKHDCIAAVESNGEITYRPALDTLTKKDLDDS